MSEITVVITTYKLLDYIAKCFDELLAQSFQDFNIVVVDDCSPDGTADIVRQYELRFPERIHAFYLQKNLGCEGKTRNYALDSGLVDGKYVVFLDGDDSIEPDFLEKLHAKAVETGADVTMCGYDRVEDVTGHVLCREMQGFPSCIHLSDPADTLCYANAALWNKLIRREVIGDFRVPFTKVGADLGFIWQVYSKCSKVAFLDDVLIHYRVRANSVIANTSAESITDLSQQLQELLDHAPNEDFHALLSLITFIHIGVSMALRAKNNPSIDLNSHLRWTRDYLERNGLLKAEGYLTFRALRRHGIKGLGIWGCRILHRLGWFQLFLWFYGFVTKTFHIDIKF